MGVIAETVASFVSVFAEGVKRRGFTQRQRTFERRRGEVIDTIYLQGAQRNRAAREFPDSETAYLYVNLYAYLPRLEATLGREPQLHPGVRGYFERLQELPDGTWRFTLDDAPSAATRCLDMLDSVGEAWFDSWSYEKIVADAEAATDPPASDVLAAAELLGQPERYWTLHELRKI